MRMVRRTAAPAMRLSLSQRLRTAVRQLVRAVAVAPTGPPVWSCSNQTRTFLREIYRHEKQRSIGAKD